MPNRKVLGFAAAGDKPPPYSARARLVLPAFRPALAGLFCTAAAAACAPDSVVLVLVEGQVQAPIMQFRVEVAVGTSMRSILVPSSPRPIALPTTFSLQIPETTTGRLRVLVIALGASGEELARASDERPSIAAGALNQLSVKLAAGPPGPAPVRVDAGAPDVP